MLDDFEPNASKKPTGISENQTDYIFVYGTLRRDSPEGAHKAYLNGTHFISPAQIRGRLYMVNYYPGLVLTETDHWATGEVYLIQHASQLHDLDVYEGCAKKSPQPHEYARQIVDVVLSDGEILQAWAYVYILNTQNLPVIESGNFLQPTAYAYSI
jgi:gamma-glutamylcyclotransferase (GGCT)/AIG2-like uncharacterized protein YtfP